MASLGYTDSAQYGHIPLTIRNTYNKYPSNGYYRYDRTTPVRVIGFVVERDGYIKAHIARPSFKNGSIEKLIVNLETLERVDNWAIRDKMIIKYWGYLNDTNILLMNSADGIKFI